MSRTPPKGVFTLSPRSPSIKKNVGMPSSLNGARALSPSPTAMVDTESPVGLSDPTVSGNRRELLDLVNRLRNTGVQSDIDLPMIAVIGNQSAGKSSLIEAISGITLPRSAGTCTRCPTECKLTYSEDAWICVVKLHFNSDAEGKPIDVRLIPFGDPITTKSEVEDRIRRAQRAILNPSQDHNKYLDDDISLPDKNELSFSRNYVSLEISGRDLVDLSFVDLPGFIAGVSDGGDERDIELVKNLAKSYIEKPSCVILLTVACETDFQNQGAHLLAKQYDPEGQRTVGVLTKPDRIPEGDEESWLRMIRNEKEPLLNNWYCVKQPSTQRITEGVTWAQARRDENEFFTLRQPWCNMEAQYQKYFRTSSLTERLSSILLPTFLEDLNAALEDTQRRLSALPKEPSNDPVGEVLRVVNDFTSDLEKHLEGNPDEHGLVQTIRPHQQAFKKAIRQTVPNFVPLEKKKAPHKALPAIDFLAHEEAEEDIEEERQDIVFQTPSAFKPLGPGGAKPKSADFNKIYVDEVLKRAHDARTRELPDNYPFIVQKAYIEQFTSKWRQPAMDLFEQVYGILKKDLARLVRKHFGNMGKGHAKDSVLIIVNDHLDEAATRTKERIDWLLAIEQAPTTLNTHYYSDYKDKFLAHYRGCRERTDLTSKLRAITGSSEQAAISRVLSGLSELGISVKATDLPKLLPPDPMEAALNIMASVRAYFQVAYKRFADTVPMAIDYEIVLGLKNGMHKALQDGLEITGPEGYTRCRNMLQEFSSVSAQRQEVKKKMERLQAARQELKRLSL